MVEYEKDAIVQPYITTYIRDVLKKNDGFLSEMESYAEKNSVPIVQPETAHLLSALALAAKPKKILEVGCAIGYSSILMSEALSEGGKITTLEYNPDMVKIARENIKRANLTDKIEVIEADAKEHLKTIAEDGSFDIIFLDGPKAHYIYMLDDCVRLLKKGGMLISDNILYKGMTAEKSLVIRRKITLVKRLRKYITALTEHEGLETSILSVGDGVSLSVKK